jgi:glycosyl transferase family 87
MRMNLWRAFAVILGIGGLLYTATIVSVANDPDNRSPNGNVVGVDYSAFHAGGTMLRYGDARELYDIDAMTDLLREVRRGPAGRQPTFVNPPAFAMVLAVVAPLRYEAGLVVWTILGIAAFAMGLRAIGAPRPGVIIVAALLSVPGFLGVSLGQGQFFWAAIYAAILSRLRSGSQVQAGLFAALLVLKPQLLVPFILWWIVDWRRNRVALATSLAGAAVISIVPAIIYPGVYTGYASLLQAANEAFSLDGIPMGVSLRDAVDALSGGSTAVSGLVVVVGVVLFVAVLVRGVRSGWGLDAMFILTTAAGLLVLSHVLLYDWILLVPAGVLFAQKIPPRSVVIPGALVALLYSLFFQASFGITLFERFGRSLQFAPVVLVVVLVIAVRRLQAADALTDNP